MRPDPRDVTAVSEAHRLVLADVATWSDSDMRRPSLLPEWTRGHVLTHLARNADSFVNLLDGASRGEVVDQYPGGVVQREGDIERGALRNAGDVVADLERACAAVEAAMEGADDATWAGSGRGLAQPGVFAIHALPLRRWREVEVHRGDLGGELTWRSWSDAYVARDLPGHLAKLPERLAGQRWERPESMTDRELLAWLLGRNVIDGWPTLSPW